MLMNRFFLLLIFCGLVFIVGCPKKRKGPFERMGEKIDDTIDNAKEGVEGTVDKRFLLALD